MPRQDLLPDGVGTWDVDPETREATLVEFDVYPIPRPHPPDPYYEPTPEVAAEYDDYDALMAALPNFCGESGGAMVGAVEIEGVQIQAWGSCERADELDFIRGAVRAVLPDGTVEPVLLPAGNCLLTPEELSVSNCYCQSEEVVPVSAGTFDPDALAPGVDYFYFEALGQAFAFVAVPEYGEFVTWGREQAFDEEHPYLKVSVGPGDKRPSWRPRVDWLDIGLWLPMPAIGETAVLDPHETVKPGLWSMFRFYDGYPRTGQGTQSAYDPYVGTPSFMSFVTVTATTWAEVTLTELSECRVAGEFVGEIALLHSWQSWAHHTIGPTVTVTNGHFRATDPACVEF